MKSRRWDRNDVVERLRRDIWTYITRASTQEENILLSAAALLQMSPSEVRYLAQLQFILSEPVGRLLGDMTALMRRLTNTTVSETEISAQRVRGSVRWGETYSQRAATGIPNVFVTAPTRRAFNTPENEVLGFSLRAIADVGKRTGWHRGGIEGPAGKIQHRVADATRWLQSREFIDLTPAPLGTTTLSRVRAGRNRRPYQAALDVVELYQQYIARLDPHAIRQAVEQRGLVTSNDDVLLELLCAFDVIDSLRRLGWRAAAPTALVGPDLQQRFLFAGTRDGYIVELTYQATPTDLSRGSRYWEIQKAHKFSRAGGLRPDLVIRIRRDGYNRWLLIEVKGGKKRPVAESARDAALDLLGYRRAFASVLDDQKKPYGLGYVWGDELSPSTESEVTLCTPDTLSEALNLLLGSA